VDGQTTGSLPALDRADVAVQELGDLFPRIESTARRQAGRLRERPLVLISHTFHHG
jgi:hypothetical protein